MKNSLRYLIPVLGLAAAWPSARAADVDQPSTKEEKKNLRVLSAPEHHIMVRKIGAAALEPATFLGIDASLVTATLTAQLSLPEGAGLVVNHVVPDSPAATTLKPHDILLKLDDQLLVEPRQLSVLVRNHKEGDEVTLTLIRAGKQMTAKVKLAKHDLPKLGMESNHAIPGMGGSGAPAFAFSSGLENFESMEGREETDRVLSLIDSGMVPGVKQMNVVRRSGPGDRNINVTVNTGNSHVALDDEKGSLELTIADGKKLLVAKTPKGEQVFSGPVTTPEERKTLPDDIRTRLEKLEDTTQFSFKTDRDFKGAETKIVRPRGLGIAAPGPQPVEDRAALFF